VISHPKRRKVEQVTQRMANSPRRFQALKTLQHFF